MNTESNRLMELYIRKVLREVQAGKPTKNKIRSQLEDHILCAVEDSELPPEKAVKQAVKCLGDPIAIGKEYNRTYAIHMGFADWARLIGPWLVAPAFAFSLIESSRSWTLLMLAALFSIITGTFIGERFSKKTLCIYTCLLPPIAIVLWFIAIVYSNMVDLAAYQPSLHEITAELFYKNRYLLISVPVWIIGFSMSCLCRYGEIAFTPKRRKDIQYYSILIPAVLLCALLGLSVESSIDVSQLQRHSALSISFDLRKIVDIEPESYALAMPRDEAETYSESITVYDGGHMYMWTFLPGQFLDDIALFVDDYDEFRSTKIYDPDRTKRIYQKMLSSPKTYEEAAAELMSPLDCSALVDIDLETRQDIAAEVMLAIAEIFDDYGQWDGFDLFPALDRSDMKELCLRLADVEEAFYGSLREYER